MDWCTYKLEEVYFMWFFVSVILITGWIFAFKMKDNVFYFIISALSFLLSIPCFLAYRQAMFFYCS